MSLAINTDSITKVQGLGTYAAQICAQYLGGGFGDWYLPSEYELNLLYLQKYVVGGLSTNAYWSSSEYDATYAWCVSFSDGIHYYYNKNFNFILVRAIRAF